MSIFPIISVLGTDMPKTTTTATTNTTKVPTIITKPATIPPKTPVVVAPSTATATTIVTPPVTNEVTYDDPSFNIAPVVTLTIGGDEENPMLDYDASTTIEWASENVNVCTVPYLADTPNYSKPLTSDISGVLGISHLTKPQTFFINCKHPSGLFVTSSIVVTIGKQPMPTVTVLADGAEEKTDVVSGTSTIISWDSTNTSTSSCTLSSRDVSSTNKIVKEESVAILPTGQESSGALLFPKVFTVSCHNDSGTASSSVLASVLPTSRPDDLGTTTEIVSSCVTLTKNIRYGSHDDTTDGEVSELQAFLAQEDFYKNDISGFDGVGTMLAVKRFQKKEGLPVTGFVGKMTREKIKEISCGNN